MANQITQVPVSLLMPIQLPKYISMNRWAIVFPYKGGFYFINGNMSSMKDAEKFIEEKKADFIFPRKYTAFDYNVLLLQDNGKFEVDENWIVTLINE